MGSANGKRLEEICTEIEQITDEGAERLNLEHVGAEDAMEQLLALAEGAESLLMCLRNTLSHLQLKLPEAAGVERSA